MEKQVYDCREDQSVDEALRIMREQGLSYLIVVDSNLRVVGVVRRHDDELELESVKSFSVDSSNEGRSHAKTAAAPASFPLGTR